MGRIWGLLFVASVSAGLFSVTATHSAFAKRVQSSQQIWLQPPEELVRARSALKKGRYGEALQLNREAEQLQLPPELFTTVIFNYCTVYLMMGAHETALPHCDQFIDLRPNAWEGWHNRGTLHLMMGEWDKAEADFRAGLKIRPMEEALKFNLDLVERYRHLPPPAADPTS